MLYEVITLRLDEESVSPLSDEVYTKLLADFEAALRGAQAVVLSRNNFV